MRNFFLLTSPLLLCAASGFGQTLDRADTSVETSAPAPSPAPSPASAGLPKFGIAVAASTLGVGIEAATSVSRTDNLRVGFNYFSYSHDFDKDGITYHGTLKLQSAEVLFDQYIGGVFHVSPGFMFYDGNKGTANASVPGGSTFSLGGVSYFSDPANPVSGTGQVTARKASPEILIGFGNLLPRNQKHFTVNFEMGVVFQGSPSATLNLTGNTCLSAGVGCLNIATNTTAQANILAEQSKINNDLKVFKYYPVVRISFGYRF